MSQQPGQPGQSASDAAYVSIARIEKRRGQALDVVGLLGVVTGLAGLFLVLALTLGWLGLVAGVSALTLACSLVIVLRGDPVPAWLQVRPPSTDGPGEPGEPVVLDQDDDPGVPYDRSRSVEDGAPRSPMSGR